MFGWVLSFSAILLQSLLALSSRADSLTWRKGKNTVDADIATWDLVHVLENIAESTGWQIYLEPGTKRAVSTKFKDRPTDRALDLLLEVWGRLAARHEWRASRLLVFRNTERDATQLIQAARRGAKPIPNELIGR
jgi:hypothetical protein